MTSLLLPAALTPEQQEREQALLSAAVLDFAFIGMLLGIGIGAHSLTNLAEGVRGLLMAMVDLVALAVMRRLHRGRLSGFDYGTSKIEQLCSIAIAISLAVGALWVGWIATGVAMAAHSDATPLGLSLAALSGAINLYVNVITWENVRQAARGRPSAIMEAQLSSRTTKLVSSILVQVTMTLAAIAKDPVIVAGADAVGALLVCVVMARAAWNLLAEAVPDLLDRSTNHVAGPVLRQAAMALPAGFALGSYRSRGTPRSFALEVTLACAANTDVAAARQAEARLAAALAETIPDVHVALTVRAVPAEAS